MVSFSMSELAENVGNNTGDFLKDMANNVGDVICGLYKDYAGNFLGGGVSPGGAFIKGTWDSLCAPRPPGLPTTPTPPFSGGQCCSSYYQVFGVVNFYGNPNPGERSFGDPQVGKVLGVVKASTAGGASNRYFVKRERCDGSTYEQDVLSVSVDDPAQQCEITRVVPMFGRDRKSVV